MPADLRFQTPRPAPTTDPMTYNQGGAQFDEPLWDRFALDNAAPLTRELFVVPKGQNDPVSGNQKTMADTNLTAAGVRKSEALEIFGFAFRYQPIALRTAAEIQAIMRVFSESVVSFFIDSKQQYGQAKLSYIFGNCFPVISSLAAGDNLSFPFQSGFNGYWPLNETIPLANLSDFHIEVEHFTAPAAGLDGDFIECEMPTIKTRKSIS